MSDMNDHEISLCVAGRCEIILNQFRNWDAGTEYLDTVYIIRDTTCTNYNGLSSTALSSS